MATKTFGKVPKTSDEYLDELYKEAGATFPVKVVVDAGKLFSISYDTDWKEGGTTPVEVKDKKTGAVTIDYKENYSNKKLSAAQIKKIDAWIEKNLEA